MPQDIRLLEFLLERISEEEATANLAVQVSPTWSLKSRLASGGADSVIEGVGMLVCTPTEQAYSDHIAHWDPERVLAECQARRWIVEGVRQMHAVGMAGPESWAVVEFLALPYADHPDHDDDWRPVP